MFNKIKMVITLFLTIISLTNCFEISDNTKVKKNGSLIKTIIFTDDSSTVKKVLCNKNETALQIPTDESWKQTINITGTDSSKISHIATREFNNYSELNQSFKIDGDSIYKIKPEVTLKRKFQWFYTYYKYKQIYPYFGFKRFVNINEYLTRDELHLYYLSSDSLKSTEDLIEKWHKENAFTYFKIEFSKALTNLQNPEIQLDKFDDIEDTVLTIIENIVELNDIQESTTQIIDICEQKFRTKEIKLIEDPLHDILFELQKRTISIISLVGEFNVEVEMPGIILSTNSTIIEGNTVRWEFDHDRFSLEDFEMTVESRSLNAWAIYTTIIIFLGLILLVYLKSKK